MPNIHDDPLIRARFVRCDTCGRIGFPTDATWIDDRLLLVAYPAMCSHVPARTAVVDPTQISRFSLADVSLYAPGRRCAGIAFTTRKRCRSHAEAGSEFCSWHGAQNRESA
jgi:hypothetical protein